MKPETPEDSFYIGWQTRPAAVNRRLMMGVVGGWILVGAILSVAFALAQRTPDVAAYAWTHVTTYEGLLRSSPYPHLLVSRPGSDTLSAYPLVGPAKFGIAPEWCGSSDGDTVRIDAGIIYRSGSTVLEVVSERPVPVVDGPAPSATEPADSVFEAVTLVGEIVDLKCYTGAMNPGRFKPHRACAALCISGGIPPVLVVETTDGPILTFLLVGPGGEMINQAVLPHLARAVRINGRVRVENGLWILSANPADIVSL